MHLVRIYVQTQIIVFRLVLQLTCLLLSFPRRKAPQAQRQGQRPRERAQEAAVGGGQGQAGLGAAEASGASEGPLAQREVTPSSHSLS